MRYKFLNRIHAQIIYYVFILEIAALLQITINTARQNELETLRPDILITIIIIVIPTCVNKTVYRLRENMKP